MRAVGGDGRQLVVLRLREGKLDGIGFVDEVGVCQIADKGVVVGSEVGVVGCAAENGLGGAAGAAVGHADRECGRRGVDWPSELRPVAAIVALVADGVGGAHVNLVVAFDAERHGVGPGRFQRGGAGDEGDGLPLAVEGGGDIGAHVAVVDDDIIEAAGEVGRGGGGRIADEYAVGIGERRGSGGAANGEFAIDKEVVAVAAEGVNELMPLAVVVIAINGAAQFAAGDTGEEADADVARVEEDVLIVLGKGGEVALHDAEEAAVVATGVEPEGDGTVGGGDGDVLEAAQEVVAIEGNGRAIGPRHIAGRTGVVYAVEAGLRRGGVVEQYRFGQVVEGQAQQGF